MAGNKLGTFKGKTGFGKKGYKPGAMITKLNKEPKTHEKKETKGHEKKENTKVAIKKIAKKII